MSVEENKATVRRFWEEINKGNQAVLDELYATDFVLHIPLQLNGLERLKPYMSRLFIAFPDYHAIVEDMVAEGDKVATRLTASGTHQGEFLGIAPTGKQMTWTLTHINRIVGGKVVEGWQMTDRLDLLQQMGAMTLTREGLRVFPLTGIIITKSNEEN